jgi:hypothetical protein
MVLWKIPVGRVPSRGVLGFSNGCQLVRLVFVDAIEAGRVVALSRILEHEETVGERKGVGKRHPIDEVGAGLCCESGKVVGGQEAAVGVAGEEDHGAIGEQRARSEFLRDENFHSRVTTERRAARVRNQDGVDAVVGA